jgi:hypothetical protein
VDGQKRYCRDYGAISQTNRHTFRTAKTIAAGRPGELLWTTLWQRPQWRAPWRPILRTARPNGTHLGVAGSRGKPATTGFAPFSGGWTRGFPNGTHLCAQFSAPPYNAAHLPPQPGSPCAPNRSHLATKRTYLGTKSTYLDVRKLLIILNKNAFVVLCLLFTSLMLASSGMNRRKQKPGAACHGVLHWGSRLGKGAELAAHRTLLGRAPERRSIEGTLSGGRCAEAPWRGAERHWWRFLGVPLLRLPRVGALSCTRCVRLGKYGSARSRDRLPRGWTGPSRIPERERCVGLGLEWWWRPSPAATPASGCAKLGKPGGFSKVLPKGTHLVDRLFRLWHRHPGPHAQ